MWFLQEKRGQASLVLALPDLPVLLALPLPCLLGLAHPWRQEEASLSSLGGDCKVCLMSELD